MSFPDGVADYFEGVAAKYLSAVDANPDRSNQHEIGGLPRVGFKRYLGEPVRGDRVEFNARLVYISERDDAPLVCNDTLTWYGATRRDATRPLEYRLYYKSNAVTELLNEGDFFLIAKLLDGSLLLVFAPPGGTIEAQLRVLFGLDEMGNQFQSGELGKQALILPLRFLLEEIGVTLSDGDEDGRWLERLITQFGETSFPATQAFSSFARESGTEVDPINEPDNALMQWMEHEERLFRIFERHLVGQRLKQGFGVNGDDVDAFVDFSLSVHNRRKSRVGHAFEGHLEAVFSANSLAFERGKKKWQVTENNSKPDFLFPGFASYHDPTFPDERLFILGAKTTCKDRWRQVLAEAARIKTKHLITLEAAISQNQTDEMHHSGLQLVVPDSIQGTYTEVQRNWLMDVASFINIIKTKSDL
ncbi:MAG TPA: type II restriction endonuclease [Gallionella sp.]|nr:type II restriction endonuclease [Gallionella sp.]